MTLTELKEICDEYTKARDEARRQRDLYKKVSSRFDSDSGRKAWGERCDAMSKQHLLTTKVREAAIAFCEGQPAASAAPEANAQFIPVTTQMWIKVA